MKINNSILYKILEKVAKTESECWLWLGPNNGNGYGTINVLGKQSYVHRLMFIYYKGEIPEGKEIDHLCRNRGCCNPEHMEAVTHRENMLRGKTLPAMQLERDECPKGHRYSGKNRRGDRICHTCGAENARRYRKK
jgi:hypothetical protein